MKRYASYLAGAACAAALVVGLMQGASAADKKYTIYLSNNFVGNDWRQQMERVAQVVAGKPPLGDKIDLKIENADNTVQAQINSLNNNNRAKPDAILVDAGSSDALNPTLKKACDAGIVVISLDQVVTEPCAYALESDWSRIPAVLAEWTAKQIGGKGNVFVDRGLPGAPISKQLEDGYMAVLAKYPDIKVIGNYNGQYALGPEQEGVASLLAAHPDVDAILTQGYGTGALKALQDAGKKPVPVTAFSYNGTAVTCAQTAGAKCIVGANPAWLSAEALRLAVDILDGKKPKIPTADQRHILINAPFMTTDPVKSDLFPDAQMVKIELGKNAFTDMAPGVTLPITPDWVEITPKEAAGS